MPSHPEFICVGAQKAGTAWLYDQACSHPRVWMPPLKEIRYFMPIFHQLKELAAKRLRRSALGTMLRKTFDERDLEFLRRVTCASGGADATSLDEYVHLFEPAGDLVTGDITPGYHALREGQIFQLADSLPKSRFIFLLRDPIDRLWSQVNMMVRAGSVPTSVLENRQEFETVMRRPRCVSPSFQSNAIRRWHDGVGGERFRVFVMDELRLDPVGYRRAVFAHIGLDADECRVEAGFNRKVTERKIAIPDHYLSFLLDYFGEEYETLMPFVDRSKVSWRSRPRLAVEPAEAGSAHEL